MTDDAPTDHLASVAPPARPTWRRLFPEGRAAWIRTLVTVATFLVIAVSTVSYTQHLERQRCEDTILSRGDLRSGITRAIEVIVEDTQPNPGELDPLIDHVREVMADEFGDPACAERWNIDPATVRRNAGLPADPSEEADALGTLALGDWLSAHDEDSAPFGLVGAG